MSTHPVKACFVIGPIGTEGSPERTRADWLLDTIIKPVLVAEPFRYQVQRADEIAQPGLITDQIIAAVLQADLVIADLTGTNSNAFYELGIRHAAERPTIHMVEAGHALPFDLKDYRAIFYKLEHPAQLAKARYALAEQVKATEAEDYVVMNPVLRIRQQLCLRRDGRDLPVYAWKPAPVPHQ